LGCFPGFFIGGIYGICTVCFLDRLLLYRMFLLYGNAFLEEGVEVVNEPDSNLTRGNL
jgi:hypothetical protein